MTSWFIKIIMSSLQKCTMTSWFIKIIISSLQKCTMTSWFIKIIMSSLQKCTMASWFIKIIMSSFHKCTMASWLINGIRPRDAHHSANNCKNVLSGSYTEYDQNLWNSTTYYGYICSLTTYSYTYSILYYK